MLECSCSLASKSDQQSEKKLLCGAALLWVCKQHSVNNILMANDPITLVSEIFILIFQNVVRALPQWFIAILKYIYILTLLVFFIRTYYAHLKF